MSSAHRRALLASALAVLRCAVLAIALGSVASPAAAQPAAPIRIGLSGSFSGPAAAASEWEKWGVEYAIEGINASGGLLGRKVELVAVDNRCNPTEGANSARSLVQRKVSAIIGGHCSSATLAMMPIIQEAGIPMITGVSSSPRITELSGAGGNPFMFRISPDDLRMARGLTEYLGQNRLFRSLAVVAEDSDFGRGGEAAFAPLAKAAGLSIVSTDFVPQMTPDFTPLLTRVAQRRPDAIALFMLGADALNLFRTAMQMGLAIPFTGRAEFAGRTIELIQAGGLAGSITAWTYSPDMDTPANQAFAKAMLERHKMPATLQMWGGHDTMQVIAASIRAAGSDDPAKVRDAMTKTRVVGLHGRELTFDDRNQAGRLVVLLQIRDRKVQIRDTYELK